MYFACRPSAHNAQALFFFEKNTPYGLFLAAGLRPAGEKYPLRPRKNTPYGGPVDEKIPPMGSFGAFFSHQITHKSHISVFFMRYRSKSFDPLTICISIEWLYFVVVLYKTTPIYSSRCYFNCNLV